MRLYVLSMVFPGSFIIFTHQLQFDAEVMEDSDATLTLNSWREILLFFLCVFCFVLFWVTHIDNKRILEFPSLITFHHLTNTTGEREWRIFVVYGMFYFIFLCLQCLEQYLALRCDRYLWSEWVTGIGQ